MAWAMWSAVALAAGAGSSQEARGLVALSVARACDWIPFHGGHECPVIWPIDARSLAVITACACVACGAVALLLRGPSERQAMRMLAISLCLASCCLLGASWRQRADESWDAIVSHIAPCMAPRLVELEGIALSSPSSDERSHLGDEWGDALSRFTPPSPSSSIDLRVCTPHGRATVRVRVDGHRLAVLAGDRVRATGWVRALGAATNPGGFDGERWSASRRVAAIMDSESPAMVASDGPDPGIDGVLARWRAGVEDHLHRSMPEWASHAARALVGASIIGVSWPGASQANDAFAGTGIQHLVAISGFNMGVLAAVALVPLARLRRPRLEGIALILLALLFASSIHTEVSAVRAALMAAGVGAVRCAGLRCSGEAVVAIAATAIVAADPPQAANPGFQLSFAAVIGLMRASRPLERALMRAVSGIGIGSVLLRKAIPAASASVAAWSATAPVTVMHFGQIALWAIPITIALSPLFAALVVAGSAAPALSALSPAMGSAAGTVAAADAQLLVRMASLAAHLPGAIVRTGGAGPAQVDPPGAPHALRIDSIDVRDGSCHLIRSRDAAIIFDAGSIGSATLGSGTVIPALHALGVRRIDAVIISHANFDHFSAVPEVIDAMAVPLLLVSADSIERACESPRGSMAAALRHASDAGCTVTAVGAGDCLAVSPDMHLRILWPTCGAASDVRAGARSRPRGAMQNSRSVTALIEVACDGVTPVSALFAGDLSGHACDAVREELHCMSGALVAAEVPHHGSPDPSGARMIASLRPRVAIQSTGMRRLQRDAIASLIEFSEPFAIHATGAELERGRHEGQTRGPRRPCAAIPRLVTARHGAVAVVAGTDGSLRVGRFDRGRYDWRMITPPSRAAPTPHQQHRAVEHEHVTDRSSLPLADLDRQRRVRARERWIEPEVERERGGRCIKRRTEELPTSLLHDHWSVRPLAQPVTHRELAHESLAPLGDFVDEPYRPPDLERGEAERGIVIERLGRAGRLGRKLHIGCRFRLGRECGQRHHARFALAREHRPVQLFGRQHHKAAAWKQGRAGERKREVADWPELGSVDDRAIGLPHAHRKLRGRACDKRTRRDPIHRYLAALTALIDHEDLADALHHALDHVAIGEPHHI